MKAGVTFADFKITKSHGWCSAKCRICFTVSPNGRHARRAGASFNSVRELHEWLNEHEHTSWRTLEAAVAERRHVFREVHEMSESVTLSGGDMDGETYVVKPGVTSVWSINEYEPGWFQQIAYEASDDPKVWTMRVLTEAEIAADKNSD